MLEELVIVMAPGQNRFFLELAQALRFEIERLNVRCSISKEGFPPLQSGRIYALLPPHEYFALTAEDEIDKRALKRTLFITAEQPGTTHFEENVRLANLSGGLFDINRSAARAYARRGVAARYLQLGYSPSLDHFPGESDPKIDLLFMGAYSPRRARVLAGCARNISLIKSRLVISDNSRPNPDSSAAFVSGENKVQLLRDSRMILNIHQNELPYFEWARVIDAIHCGCVILTEHSTDYHPLVPGVHLASARPKALGDLIEWLVTDGDTRRSLSLSAYRTLKDELPLSKSVEEMLEVAEDLAAPSTSSMGHRLLRLRPLPRRLKLAAHDSSASDPPIVPPTPYRADPETGELRRALKEVRLDLLDLRRQLHRSMLAGGLAGTPVDVKVSYRSVALRANHPPLVTVITALYNHQTEIVEALDSVLTSRLSELEVVVVDDGSTDGSLAAAQHWGEEHPEVPLLILQHPVNRGLPWARNSAIDFARGEYCFVLDADNNVLQNSLTDLVEKLNAEPSASFAYGILAMHSGGNPFGLLSWYPWEPLRLRYGNYIDAMAMFRTSALRSMQGYSTDRRLYGWEDYDLYCRLAEAGHEGAFVPSIVAGYRVSSTSMRSLSDLSYTAAFEALKEHCPQLMKRVHPPF
jgi:GT2 family glycosyltransferase